MNFTTLQREVKVTLKPVKTLKGKQKEAEDSRIDFQLTWDSDSSTRRTIESEPPIQEKNSRKKAKTITTIQKDASIDSLMSVKSSSMLLEVKSVTLSAKLPGDNQVCLLLCLTTCLDN